MANDVFANIAANGIGGRQEFLSNPEPMKFEKKFCALNNSDLIPFKVREKMVLRCLYEQTGSMAAVQTPDRNKKE